MDKPLHPSVDDLQSRVKGRVLDWHRRRHIEDLSLIDDDLEDKAFEREG